MAKFNCDYYFGHDDYSDGSVEDLLFQMAEHGKTIEELRQEEVSWPVFYHMSHLRENIINWYPMSNDQSVLEIGSGCGAITGALCRKAKHVYSIELSKKRALINYLRHRDFENLDIIVGNFYNIPLLDKYDYIILNGVFEYAMSFIDGNNPYQRLLMLCKKYLKQNGKILISIENRLGLKYIAGSVEEHTRSFFLGLNNYTGNSTVRTFSKNEWLEMLEFCKMKCKFYYPYPDYKFTVEIFTDRSLGSNGFGLPYLNFDNERFEWIYEREMSKTLLKENIADHFANSFFIEICSDGSFTPIDYSKCSCNRSINKRIITSIYNEHGKKTVKKIPANNYSCEHIDRIFQNGNRFISDKIINWEGVYENSKIEYECLPYLSLSELLRRIIAEEDRKKFIDTISNFYAEYFSAFTIKDFQLQEKFIEIFGYSDRPYIGNALDHVNIDLIFENVFYDRKHGIYYLIDPEWVFDFPIPSSFIIWRGIYDFYCKTEKAEAFFTQLDLLAKFGISQNDILTFMQWNDSFTYKFVGAQRLDRYSKLRIYASMDYLTDLYYRENTIDCSLFLDYGEGFNEKDKLHTRALLINQEFSVTFNICNYTNVKAMRFDPIEGFACQCQVCSNECSLEPLNVAYKRDSFDVFLTDDPIYLVKPYSYKINSITISGKLVKLTHSKLIKELKFNLLE